MIDALYTGIYNHFTSDNQHAFYTGVGGRFYVYKAPQRASFPYCVYSQVVAAHEVDFGEQREDVTIQFNIFSQNNSSDEADTLLDGLISMFDNCALTVTGWRHLDFLREIITPHNDLSQVPPIMGYSVDYSCIIEKVK